MFIKKDDFYMLVNQYDDVERVLEHMNKRMDRLERRIRQLEPKKEKKNE